MQTKHVQPKVITEICEQLGIKSEDFIDLDFDRAFDAWLRYQGIINYSSQIASVYRQLRFAYGYREISELFVLELIPNVNDSLSSAQLRAFLKGKP